MPEQFGIIAHRSICWLLLGEPEVREAVRKFMLDCGPAIITVAGLPEPSAIIGGRAHRELQTVVLRLSRAQHPITEQLACRIECGEADLEKVVGWHRRAS